MTDSIKYDYKFVRLLNRLLHEHKQVRASRNVIWKLNDSDILPNNISAILEDMNRDLKVKSETTLKHIFKYIDRRVEREVSIALAGDSDIPKSKSEKEAQSQYDKVKPLYEKIKESFLERSVEMLRSISPDGLCSINARYATKVDYSYIERIVRQELLKINPLMIFITPLDFYAGIRHHCFGAQHLFSTLTISFMVSIRGQPHSFRQQFKCIDGYIKFYPSKVAQYFSDEINKIAREKHDSRTI